MTLLPCPFCGGIAEIYHGDGDTFWYAWCTQCEVSQSHYDHETEKTAVEAWNNRVLVNFQLSRYEVIG